MEVNEEILNQAFRNMILNNDLVFADFMMTSQSGWNPQIYQSAIRSNLFGYGYSPNYGVRFQGIYLSGHEPSWQLTVVLKEKGLEASIFTLVIPHKAFIRIEFQYMGLETVICTFITANPNPPLDKNCRTREEHISFIMTTRTKEGYAQIKTAIEELTSKASYTSFDPLPPREEPVYLSTPYF